MARLKSQVHSRPSPFYSILGEDSYSILEIISEDHTNRLCLARVVALTEAVEQLASAGPQSWPLILTGNRNFFSVGADLNEILRLEGASANEFARAGQKLMLALESFPALTIAAIQGYCMGGGLDLALACVLRLAAPNAIFGHRGAAMGLITGWGGTQRLTRLLERSQALQIFTTAAELDAAQALSMGLISRLEDKPVEAAREITKTLSSMPERTLKIKNSHSSY